MGDGYWNRQGAMHPSASGLLKRPRSDYDAAASRLPMGRESLSYLSPEDDHGGPWMIKDTKVLGSAYDRYLQNAQLSLARTESSSLKGGGLRATNGGGMPALPLHDPVVDGRPGSAGPDLAPNGRRLGFSGPIPDDDMATPRQIQNLPTDASSTLYVEGLPPDCSKREVSHIFRPFVGYKEVRLVVKESKHRGGQPLILCFVDFMDPACAATALSALQGYKMDEKDPESANLRLQFSKFPGPRSGGGSRGRR